MTSRATAGETFTLSSGRVVRLDPAHRASVRAASGTGYGRESMVEESERALESWLAMVDRRVDLAARVLGLFGGSIEGAAALVVGASEGGECAQLARRGARSVVGTDYGDVFEGEGRIGARRDRVLGALGDRAGRVAFRVDDVTSSAIESGRFDLILSWQTLEHVADPAAAMVEMKRLLRPGGLMFHEYNPFLAIDGGHSLCTLDFPWGHARASAADFERFVRERRPGEAERAIAFFTGALNRMTMADLEDHVAAAGLETLALAPRTRTEDLMLLERATLEDVRANYPRASVVDLSSRIVRVAARG
jgi:SAM-dependent methyltransferase